MRGFATFLRLVLLIAVLILFFVSIELMGASFKLMGREFARTLLETTANPFMGLFIGILATSLVQSSSTVTSMTVTLVAGGGLTISGAIPIMLGANIGTSVTNTIVSLGSVTRKEEFGRAMAGATVHDFFNLLAVALLFPIELFTHAISGSAAVLTDALAGVGGVQLLSPVDVIVEPISGFIIDVVQQNGIAVLAAGLVLLFISLRNLVGLLKSLVMGRSEKMLHKYIFGPPLLAMLFGVLITIMVQSSSITTSVTVPLVAAGIVSVAQIFPFVLGANIGTTVTALLAALMLASDGGALGIAALTVAFAHLVFNVFGIAIFYPIRQLREVPIKLAHWLGDLAVKNRAYAVGYVVTVFFVMPLLIIVITRQFDVAYTVPRPDVLEEAPRDTIPPPGARQLDLRPGSEHVMPYGELMAARPTVHQYQ